MRVLWFEISAPSRYVSGGKPTGGWQDSLERIVRTIPEIELLIAFRSETYSEIKIIDGVTYIPFPIRFNFFDKTNMKYWDVYVNKMLPEQKRIVEQYKPDLIHVFGTEWPYGQIAAYTSVPVVIHIMGAFVPIKNADYPPGYSYEEKIYRHLVNPSKLWNVWKSGLVSSQRVKWERSTWNLVSNYMGRTQWDKSLSRVMHPDCRYFHVEEALRLCFVNHTQCWSLPSFEKVRLITTGCANFWKGPDMMLKVAKILKELNVDFEWNVAGRMDPEVKRWVERKEKAHFNEYNVNILGFVNPDKLTELLCSSTMYVHTAYIENSPNAICEAQCLGVPVVSTNVGGIASLVRHGKDGILVPANDPWQMADAIIQLAANRKLMQEFSTNSQNLALQRHNDENIKTQLLQCYHAITKETENK